MCSPDVAACWGAVGTQCGDSGVQTAQGASGAGESGCANGGDLDLISPQLYTTGYETAPDFAVTSSCASVGCGWELYHSCNPKFVPSIVEDSHYAAVQAWASGTAGVQAEGFFQWKMVV